MFDGTFAPVLTVQPGDTVVLQAVSGMPHVMPPPEAGLTIPDALAKILAAKLPSLGAHLVTGPVAIAGAEPGDMLEICIDAIEFGADWGYWRDGGGAAHFVRHRLDSRATGIRRQS